MQCYRLTSRLGGARTYWVLARNDRDARRFAALNIPGAEGAERIEDFCCVVDRTKAPPVGFIQPDDGELIAIERL